MKSQVIELAASKTGFDAKFNIMREYLQSYILKIMFSHGVFKTTAFLGGTALRFMHNLPRFSADLDFSLKDKTGFSFRDIIAKIQNELKQAGYEVVISYNDEKTVNYAMIKFPKLLHEAGVSPFADQNISIKIDVDTNPPRGETSETIIVNKYFPIAFLSYDLSSLFAGKLHAILNRRYTKGRDYFDIGWYLSKWKDITPNLTLLNNALTQTGWKKESVTSENWKTLLREAVSNADWNKVKNDVTNFLENPSDINIFTKENVLTLIHPPK